MATSEDHQATAWSVASAKADSPPARYFEQWSKLPREVRDTLRRSEDYLVAHTFGVLRYLPGTTLKQLLMLLGISTSHEQPEVDLWPQFDIEPARLADAGLTVTEPDAYLHAHGFSCLVEAKYVGSQLGWFLSQLGREWLLARRLRDASGSKGPCLLLVTMDPERPFVPALDVARSELAVVEGAPRVTIEQQIVQFITWAARFDTSLPIPDEREVAEGVRWVPWSRVAEACRALLREKGGVEPSVGRILRDVLAVLSRFNADPFRAWQFAEPWLPTSSVSLWTPSPRTREAAGRWPELPAFGPLPTVGASLRLFNPSDERLWAGLGGGTLVEHGDFKAPWG